MTGPAEARRHADLPPLAEEYLQVLQVERALSPLTLREYAYDLRAFCRWLAAQRHKPPEALELADFAAVDRPLLRRWLQELDRRQLALATRARKLAAVGGLFKLLVADGRLPRDPFAGLPRPGRGERHRRVVIYLSEAEAERLLQTIPSSEGLTARQAALHRWLADRDLALVVVLLYQGLRIGEAARLRLGDVDFREGSLRVLGKGDKERIVPLHPRSAEALRRYLERWRGPRRPREPRDPLWWTLRGTPLTRGAAQKAVKRHLVRAGLWRASAHKLRHTFGTRLADAGVDLLLIRDLMGHASVATTQVYTHVQRRRLRDAIERLR